MKISSTAALCAAFFLVSLAACVSHAAGEAKPSDSRAAAGRAKAGPCAVCHGQNGIAVTPMTANLAGQQRDYLEETLKNYRSGKRQHEVMTIMAKPLSDDDIANLAAWYSSIAIEVKVPEK
jgi:cytochrome c553